MEHPHDPYHVRPFPKQPHKWDKDLKTALKNLEEVLSSDLPDFERLRAIQARIHEKTQDCTDDRLVDMLRQISNGLDEFHAKPERAALEKILKQLLKLRVELKHL